MALPGMTEPIADAILDWIDTDSDHARGGRAGILFGALAAVLAAERTARSIEELLLVRDVTPRDAVRGGYESQCDDRSQRGALHGDPNVDNSTGRSIAAGGLFDPRMPRQHAARRHAKDRHQHATTSKHCTGSPAPCSARRWRTSSSPIARAARMKANATHRVAVGAAAYSRISRSLAAMRLQYVLDLGGVSTQSGAESAADKVARADKEAEADGSLPSRRSPKIPSSIARLHPKTVRQFFGKRFAVDPRVG